MVPLRKQSQLSSLDLSYNKVMYAYAMDGLYASVLNKYPDARPVKQVFNAPIRDEWAVCFGTQ